jgi:broad specificity phosphatase PhoE
MEKHIYFVRHGESDSNSGGIMLGAEAVLTEKGKREAELVAGRIERIGVDALISSTYQRTLDTAQAIADRIGLPIEQSDLFIECRRPSSMLGQSWRDPKMKELDASILEGYASTPGYRHSDEESFPELKQRTAEALEFLRRHEANRICVTTHGMFLRALLGAALFGKDFDARHYQHLWYRTAISNTGITVLSYTDERGWYLHTWNDSAHLG